MRIYLGACGLGLGHITRSERLARLFLKQGHEIHFSSYSDGIEYLKRTELSYFSTLPISFRTREDGTIDPKLTATQNGVTVGLWKFVRQLIAEVEQIIKFHPDIVISDTRVTTLMAGVLLRLPTCLMLNQYSVQMPNNPRPGGPIDRGMFLFSRIVWKYATTILGLVWGMSKLILVPDMPPPHTISAYNLSFPERLSRKVKLVGSLNPATPGATTNHPGKKPQSLQVFVCVSGPATDRKYLIRALSTVLGELPSDWKLVMSCGNPKGSSLPNAHGSLTTFDWMDEKTYEKAFEEADVVVSRAGHETIMTAVARGKPLVLIPPPNHTEQANNARRCAEMGLGVLVSQEALNGESLARAVRDSAWKCSEKAAELANLLNDERRPKELVETVSRLADHTVA